MWNSQNPLKLLLSMPAHLELDNLRQLQDVIDVDKIENSRIYKHDLCGEYAPFCDFCDKNLVYPCAHAYVFMKQSEGLDVEIDPEAMVKQEPAKTEATVQAEEVKPEVQPETTEEKVVEEEVVVEEKPKKTIRIAHVRRTR